MTFPFSRFGQNFATGSGIGELMDDLGDALSAGGADIKMLGGGQPAQIPEINAVWRRRMLEIMDEAGGMELALSWYDPPGGNRRFRAALAALFHREFGWEISEENVAVTAGGQSAFFLLFNLLAGSMPDGSRKHVLLPLVPEYIGYSDLGADGGMFKAIPPKIIENGSTEFKYSVDFDRLKISDDIAAICASRPTNPTGNVLTDEEVARLSELAKQHGIPLILDNAYGAPFPGIIFANATPFWDEHVILTLSLSKLGLPGTRTGIVIGPPEIVRALSSMNAIAGLSNPNLGQQITLPLIESGEILSLSREVIRPFYQEKCIKSLAALNEIFGSDFPWRVHRTEGALFLWLWFPGLSISSAELYQRLKKRGVLVIPGHYFFFGHDDPNWRHRHECLRLSYAMDERTVREGLTIIADEVRKSQQG